MNDKEANKQKKRVRFLFDKWVKQIGLGWYRIRLEWSRESIPPTEGTYTTDTPSAVVFQCYSDSNYMDALIICYLPNISQLEDDHLETIFVHELMHIFLTPMRTKAKSAQEEEVATRLAKAMIWAVDLVPKKERELKKAAHAKLKKSTHRT